MTPQPPSISRSPWRRLPELAALLTLLSGPALAQAPSPTSPGNPSTPMPAPSTPGQGTSPDRSAPLPRSGVIPPPGTPGGNPQIQPR